jgi:hypothetical protein
VPSQPARGQFWLNLLRRELRHVLAAVEAGVVVSCDEDGREWEHTPTAFVAQHDLMTAPDWYTWENGNG